MLDPQTVVTNPDLSAQVANLNTLLSQLSQFTSHVSTGAMTAHAIQWLKGTRFVGPWWKLLSDRAKVIWGLFAAAIPASGIAFTFSHPAAGAYNFVFTGVTASAIGALIWSILQNWVFQQGWYQRVIKATQVTGVAPIEGVPPAAPVGVVVEGVKAGG